jgi:hypothetical protein
MKRAFLSALFLILVLSLPAQPLDGPFGLRMGLTLEQIQAIDPDVSRKADNAYLVTVVPQPDPRFEFYTLAISPDSGLAKVVAVSKEITVDEYATELIAEFSDIQEEMSHTYGDYEESDWWISLVFWEDQEYFMYDLMDEEIEMISYWTRESGAELPEGIQALELEGYADSPESGYLLLSFEFDNFGEFLRQSKEEE